MCHLLQGGCVLRGGGAVARRREEAVHQLAEARHGGHVPALVADGGVAGIGCGQIGLREHSSRIVEYEAALVAVVVVDLDWAEVVQAARLRAREGVVR
ncbi:MAG: hypothetical protein J6T59_03040, partial [Bacteroidales bacterium]|nr:hypothetical protein [Bacteroidales bacterium]